MSRDFFIGVVEGFYGQQWSLEQRLNNIKFFQQQNFKEYLYAPKGDQYLRKQWFLDWPVLEKDQIKQLISFSKSQNVLFSVGLSPLGFSQGEIAHPEQRLIERIEGLRLMGISRLYLLFDDMKGDDPLLAKKQSDIIVMVQNSFPELSLGFCPSYYSDDPILDKVFGSRPSRYLEQLGELISPEVDMFWTGEKVCSPSYSIKHIQTVAKRMQRKPLLWDNYPVNDGKNLCKKLHLAPFRDRPAELSQYLAGHMANPMNQAYLSQLPLMSLAANYQQADYQAESWFEKTLSACNPEEKILLLRDYLVFTEQGLDAFDLTQIEELKKEYSHVKGEYAHEVYDWLDGRYAFDPACLT